MCVCVLAVRVHRCIILGISYISESSSIFDPCLQIHHRHFNDKFLTFCPCNKDFRLCNSTGTEEDDKNSHTFCCR